LKRGGPVDRLKRRAFSPIVNQRRRHAESLLANLAPAGPPLVRKVLIDATFDNPNYWLRLALVRAPLGLHKSKQIAFTGAYSVSAAERTLLTLGINTVRSITRKVAPDEVEPVRHLLARARTAGDVLSLDLPYGLPASDLYDALLKRQRRASLDLTDPTLADKTASFLATQDLAERLFEVERPDLLIATHTASGNTAYGPVAWAAARRGIPILVPWGNFGVLWIYRADRWHDVYKWPAIPEKA